MRLDTENAAHAAYAELLNGACDVIAHPLSETGAFADEVRISWKNGTFALDAVPHGGRRTGGPLWIIPGIVDAHVHTDHHKFMPEDDARIEQRETLTREALARTLSAGITSARDAGGLNPAFLDALPAATTPRLQTSIAMIDRATADAGGGVAKAAERALAAGARWVKLMATGSVASPPDTDLAPVFTASEVRDAVRAADQVGAGVMMHAWGGEAIDQAIDAGVMSLEHGIYLTEAQARRAAEHGMTFVPTLHIYRFVQRLIADGDLPEAFRRRVDDAVERHPAAVRIARDAGLPIALGSDYGTTEQHGTNRREFDALVGAGLSAEEALVAATRTGAALLRRAAPDPESLPSGRIADGEIADAVIFARDPREPGTFTRPDSVIAVIQGGTLISPNHTQ